MNKPLILIVEDDPPIRNLISVALETHDYRFLSASNGGTAIMEASSHNPDIMLLDLGLPDLDGVDTVQQQVAIARKKAGIGPDEKVSLQRFEVVRHT